MSAEDAVWNLPLFFVAIVLLSCFVLLLASWKKLASLKTGDKILIIGWLSIFTWTFGGMSLATLTHRASFAPRGVLLVFGIILFAFATILWAGYRVFRSSLDADKKNRG